MGATCTEHARRPCSIYDVDSSKQQAPVQRFEIIDERLFSIDKMNRVLSCERMIWQCKCRRPDLTSSSVEYRPMPLVSVKGFTYLLRTDFAVDVLSDHFTKTFEVYELSGGESGRASHLIYVNRFFNLQLER